MMPAITLHQPWASLVAIGAKCYETRAYPPPLRHLGQRIAIHAAGRPAAALFRQLDGSTQQAIAAALTAAGYACATTADLNDLPRGAVVCTAVLTGAAEVQGYITSGPDAGVAAVVWRGNPLHGTAARRDTVRTDPFGDYSPGRWAWLLTDVQPLPQPVTAKGKRGWWQWEYPREEADVR